MSSEAVTARMLMLDQLWELAVSLKDSKLGPRVEPDGMRVSPPEDMSALRPDSSR